MANDAFIVPIKEACRLWQRDKRTLKKWALKGILRYDVIGDKNSERACWYIETPAARQQRVFNN